MAKIDQQDYPLNPTLRLVNDEGRATSEFFRILKAIGKVLRSVNIVDGEITTDMLMDLAVDATKLDDGAVVVGKLAAGSIYVDTLFVNNVVKTGAVASNAITEVTTAAQVGTGTTASAYLIQATVPVTSTGNTGVLVSFTAFMRRPFVDSSNFGDWRLELHRNGVVISQTPNLFYDDNFAYPVICAFVDETPGTNPLYEIVPIGISGLCIFDIEGGLGVFSLLKR